MNAHSVEMKEHLNRILALKNQEDTKYHYELYASRFILYCEEKLIAPPEVTHAFDNELRGRICAWNFRVVDHCNFPRELAERSLSFFDRCVATRGNRCPTEESSWLAGMVALYLAIKIHHTTPIGIDFLVALSRNQFTAQQIIAMESFMIRTLLWHLNPPTATEFAFSFIAMLPNEVTLPVKSAIFEWVKFSVYSCVCDSYFVPFRPSSIAYAALLNVIEDMKLLQVGGKLGSFIENEIGFRLLGLNFESDESQNILLLRNKIREVSKISSQDAPPAAIDLF